MRQFELYPFTSTDRGVYKMVINDKWFYYGSSTNLKRRQFKWRWVLNTAYGNQLKNILIKKLHPIATKISFYFIESVPDGDPKDAERYYIKKHFEDDFCLNIIPDSVNAGVKWHQGKRKKDKPLRIKKRVKNIDNEYKTIYQCKNKEEIFHESVELAAIYCNGKKWMILRALNGAIPKYKGSIWKYA